MAFQVRPTAVAIALCWVLSIERHCSSVYGKRRKPEVPCFFIFGDSLADNGNNNLLNSWAKANHRPYGIDYPGRAATGRFTNGRTTVDLLAEHLGLRHQIPPFALLNSSNILLGVNYASGGSGIRSESGSQLGGRISMDEQLKNHEIAISRIAYMLAQRDPAILRRSSYPGVKQRLAKKYLSKCLYSVGMGSNDYINNYFLPQHFDTSKKFDIYQYAEALVQQYTQQIKKLHEYGARKVIVVGVGLIGCTPAAISSSGTNGTECVDKMNLAAQEFNQKLVTLVEQLNKNLRDSQFIYINSFEMGSGDPAIAGFKYTNVSCCVLNEVSQCKLDQAPCKNRAEYVFFDGFHPTEAANRFTAIRSYSGALNLNDTYPMGIKQLAHIRLSNKRKPRANY